MGWHTVSHNRRNRAYLWCAACRDRGITSWKYVVPGTLQVCRYCDKAFPGQVSTRPKPTFGEWLEPQIQASAQRVVHSGAPAALPDFVAKHPAFVAFLASLASDPEGADGGSKQVLGWLSAAANGQPPPRTPTTAAEKRAELQTLAKKNNRRGREVEKTRAALEKMEVDIQSLKKRLQEQVEDHEKIKKQITELCAELGDPEPNLVEGEEDGDQLTAAAGQDANQMQATMVEAAKRRAQPISPKVLQSAVNFAMAKRRRKGKQPDGTMDVEEEITLEEAQQLLQSAATAGAAAAAASKKQG